MSHISSTQTREAIKQACLNGSEMSWDKVCPTATEQALDLLISMLKFNPKERITAEQTLKHPFFAEYREFAEEDYPTLSGTKPLDLSIEKSTLTEQELKKLV